MTGEDLESSRGGSGATRPLPRNRGLEELHGNPTVGPRPKVCTNGQKWKKAEMARQLPRGARPSGRPQSSESSSRPENIRVTYGATYQSSKQDCIFLRQANDINMGYSLLNC